MFKSEPYLLFIGYDVLIEVRVQNSY